MKNSGNPRLTIGQKLRIARETAELTQLQVANQSGITRPHLTRIEAGRYNVSIDTVAAIAGVLGLRLELIAI